MVLAVPNLAGLPDDNDNSDENCDNWVTIVTMMMAGANLSNIAVGLPD